MYKIFLIVYKMYVLYTTPMTGEQTLEHVVTNLFVTCRSTSKNHYKQTKLINNLLLPTLYGGKVNT